jgi:hypothetical protein
VLKSENVFFHSLDSHFQASVSCAKVVANVKALINASIRARKPIL